MNRNRRHKLGATPILPQSEIAETLRGYLSLFIALNEQVKQGELTLRDAIAMLVPNDLTRIDEYELRAIAQSVLHPRESKHFSKPFLDSLRNEWAVSASEYFTIKKPRKIRR